jgi:thymidylate kinase
MRCPVTGAGADPSPSGVEGASGGAAPPSRKGRGRFIVIAGPDGTGKTTLAEALAAAVPDGSQVRRFHHRIGVLPVREAARRPTTTPHDQPIYPGWLAAIKVAYLAVDQIVGWVAVVRPHVQSGGWVILERGWRDIVVDPRRYRLPPGGTLARRLGSLLPQPDLTVVLDAPACLIRERKAELAAAEIERQRTAWREIAGTDSRVVVLDATAPVRANVRTILGMRDRAVGPWLAVPPGRPRLTIPVRSGRTAAAGLRSYQPTTFGGLVFWMAARGAAMTGALRVLGNPRAPAIADVLAAHVPRGGSVSIAHGSRPDRAVVLLLDREGRATGAAKVALDDAGQAKLAKEVEGLTRIGARLVPPLSAPRLLAHEPGIMVLEAVAWRVRVRPWILPAEVAEGLGQFHRRPDAHPPTGIGPGHGDLAPWNLLRTADGWCLIDWEDADEAAPAFEDPLQYLVSAHALLGRPNRADLIAGVRGRGWIGRALHAYADAADIDRTSLPEAFVSYLERSRGALLPDRPDWRRGIVARDRLLAALRAGR